MVVRINNNRQNLKRFEIHRPECRNCEKDLYEYMQQKGAKVWAKGRGSGVVRITNEHKGRLYCDDCKKDLFEGVKLRKEL